MDISKNIQNVNNPAHAAHFGQVTIQDVEDHVANITQVGGGGIVDEDSCDKDGLHVRGAFIRGLLGTSCVNLFRQFVLWNRRECFFSRAL